MKHFYAKGIAIFPLLDPVQAVKRTSPRISEKKSSRRDLLIKTCCTITICSYLISGSMPAVAQTAGSTTMIRSADNIAPLRVGQYVPKDFWTKQHLYYIDGDTIRQDLSLYKGKLLVLDFWWSQCGSCIQQFKEKQLLFAKYPADAVIILVNPAITKDNFQVIKSQQNKIASRTADGRLVSIIEDSYIASLFPTTSFPRYVWISPYGNVIAQSSGLLLNEGGLKSVMDVLYKEKAFNRHDKQY